LVKVENGRLYAWQANVGFVKNILDFAIPGQELLGRGL
jgi:hypothetical protein